MSIALQQPERPLCAGKRGLMGFRGPTLIGVAAFAWTCGHAVAGEAARPRYQVVSLRSDGPLNRWHFDVLTEGGSLVGREVVVGVERVLIRQPDGHFHFPPDIPIGQFNINSTSSSRSGMICGVASIPPFRSYGWRWSEGAGFQVIPDEQCGGGSGIIAINDAGWMLQSCSGGSSRPYLLRPGTPPLRLRTRLFGTECDAVDMNSAGMVVAEDDSGGSTLRQIGLMWRDPEQPGEVLQVPSNATWTVVEAVNEVGTVAGSYFLGDSIQRGCKWTAPDERIELPPLVPGRLAQTADINTSGIVVGNGQVESGHRRGAVWLADGTVHDVNTLVDASVGPLAITALRRINDGGMILGVAEQGTEAQYVLLIPHSAPCCPPDVNGDCRVDVRDLAFFIEAFGRAAEIDSARDINRDGVVNSRDLVVLLGSFGSVCLR